MWKKTLSERKRRVKVKKMVNLWWRILGIKKWGRSYSKDFYFLCVDPLTRMI